MGAIDDDVELPDDWCYDLSAPPWHVDVVEVLDTFRALARRGEITEVAVAGVLRHGAVSTSFAGRGARLPLIAGVQYLAARLVAE